MGSYPETAYGVLILGYLGQLRAESWGAWVGPTAEA